ncbi:hypothetical protein SmJEL517_g03901 [Synchytrium microbalum]|uniref:Glyoxal oxidase N-terminal domain-containing protein n=1 Tax=Synchytrium microbalum TaxID=1806994 RepID=A0A507BUA8_9FUNG|nr:uncharacterized protein SmJEL517_g03901 [Synchytrium microbalum]TPX33080.1 hypothetical protein SmJEL517_g03901 [Synchytrium microbalum]
MIPPFHLESHAQNKLAIITCGIILRLSFVNSDPSTTGEWNIVASTGVVGIHTAILPGSADDAPLLLFWERFHGLHDPSLYPPNPNTFLPSIGQSELSTQMTWNPQNPTASNWVAKHVKFSPFCGGSYLIIILVQSHAMTSNSESIGHAQMADGSIFVAGGDGDNVANNYIADGRKAVRTYSSTTGWVDIGELTSTRWYPTASILPDGRLIIVGGLLESYIPTDPTRNNPSYEIWPADGRGSVPLQVLRPGYPNNTYSVVMVLPSQRVFIFSAAHSMTMKVGTWEAIINLPDLIHADLYPSHSFPYLSPSVLLPLREANNFKAEVMICGGTRLDNQASSLGSRIAPDDENAQWFDENMPGGRVMGDGVLLPDGNVVFVNGAQTGSADGPAGFSKARNPQYAAHLYSPVSRQWTLLLPDGRILTAGSDQQNYDGSAAQPFEYRTEVFSPPYLFSSSPRPIISCIPPNIRYNDIITISTPSAITIDLVSAIRQSLTRRIWIKDLLSWILLSVIMMVYV